MTPYKNSSKNSGVAYFEIQDDYIRVKFKHSDKIYRYYGSAIGPHKLNTMKQLAIAGIGLGTYINKDRDVYKSAVVEHMSHPGE